jgi:hypothetical protein
MFTYGKSAAERVPELRGVARWMRESKPVNNVMRRSRILVVVRRD